MLLYGWLLFFAFVSGVGSNTAGNVYTRRRNLVKLIEEAKKSVNSKVSDETVTKLAEVLAWFDEPKFSEEVIEIVFTNPLINEKLNDTQIQAVLLDFKMDGMRHSAIDAFYSKLPRTHQSSSIVEKSHVGEEINFAFKEQLRRGFTLIYTLNKIWSENYQCWQPFNQPLRAWKEHHRSLLPKTYELAVEKLVKHNHVDEGVYKMIIALSEVQEARVVELLKQLLHCDKSTEKSSFPLFNKSIVLEVNTTFRLSEGEWININALEQENVEKKINKSISNVKNIDVNAKETNGCAVCLACLVCLPCIVGLTGLGVGCVIAALPFALVEAISDAVKDQKYKKARDEFGQNIIESLKLMKERYHHVNAFHQAHREILNPLFSEFEARENQYEIAKSSLQKKLHHIEGLTETGHEFIATSLAHFTTEKTTTKVLEDLKNKLLSESDLRTVFVLNAKLNGDLIKEVLRAGKNNSKKLNELLQNAVKNNRKNANVNETSLEESVRKFVNEAKNKIAFVERRLGNFILKLCAQIVDLRIKVNGSIAANKNHEDQENQNDSSSLSLSEAIFFIMDKEKNETDWTANASEHITAEGSIFGQLKIEIYKD